MHINAGRVTVKIWTESVRRWAPSSLDSKLLVFMKIASKYGKFHFFQGPLKNSHEIFCVLIACKIWNIGHLRIRTTGLNKKYLVIYKKVDQIFFPQHDEEISSRQQYFQNRGVAFPNGYQSISQLYFSQVFSSISLWRNVSLRGLLS